MSVRERAATALIETNVPGIFACGDVCSGPVKRVASAVGEGSLTIAFVHQYLRETGAMSTEDIPRDGFYSDLVTLRRRRRRRREIARESALKVRRARQFV